ncbi:MAG: AAA family ATPase [Pseudomonadota bacterium]|nr:AAA family ATPase [Pseudomonadota bacterium]MEC8448339.1 AAA family ATPase [Pseudomonadota bacterium]MED5348789.1 AAA family ATPase [Pseudomonadota bacterium]
MRLNAIKLSGFKSFVDPTTVSFPSSMSCIVGPNGCGKSNVIDAVRWVLGESSAKNLRSDSMTDVVFNGSTSRKPVSKASVELFFDNKDGRIGGEFSSYSEISVRRSLELDGQSNYYLNGTSCRKKDITDVFLGTGLGPRSYAIIEQGMISQLVSAKPDEMRGYIEEVAGISRYLERKKETESRIKRTKENLSRLDDLRDEIQRLLYKLQRQAKAAEKYHELRKDEKEAQLLLLGAKWRDVSNVLESKEKAVKVQELKVEEINSQKNTSDSEIIKLRARQIELQTSLDKVQQEFYSYGADISRTEQELSAKKERVSEINETISVNLAQIDTRKGEIKNLGKNKSSALEELKNIQEELNSLKESDDSDSNIVEAKKLEGSWLVFITETRSLLSKLKETLLSLSSKLENNQPIDDDKSLMDSLEAKLDKLQKEPDKLTKLTQDFLTSTSKEAKQERINLIEKTDKFAELQALVASLGSEETHAETKLADLEKDNFSLGTESKELLGPINEIQKRLDELLKGRLAVEEKLLKSRKSIEECNSSIHSFEKEKIEKEQAAITLRELLENLRLERQASKIEQNNIEKQVSDLDGNLSKIKERLDKNKSAENYASELEEIEVKITRLGAINLVAMEEFEQETERKALLDEQHKELTEALETLEKAITKIDKETRTTFKDTFDKLNQSLSKSFPKLFGGGHAELVMLGDDLLNCGIGISARPPGKKNASVSQLSGGEKALTAIATVFAFFELNPAPFCLLDEVDAPLDDLNTMRFIDLVNDMSQRVQFVYITHNKISMEKSKHLMGVTMQEPGVSRMVAVDVDQAVEMAAS